jgi:repressor of nif and glnA expression
MGEPLNMRGEVLQVLNDACTPLSAREIASDLGGRYGGRSVAGALDQLVNNGDARRVSRGDGRMRPLLYERSRTAAS